jgi:Fe-S cluster assembly iron-binding protein IscA
VCSADLDSDRGRCRPATRGERARVSGAPRGIRISSGVPGPAGTPLQVALADEPEAADQAIEEGGATVFVEATAAEFLDDKILDASVEADGVRFALLELQQDASGEGAQPS